MMHGMNFMNARHASWSGWLLLVWLFRLLAGCATHDGQARGQWLEDETVLREIEAGKIFSGYTYYYLGSVTVPKTFIAIENHWHLRTQVWAKITMTPKLLAGWLQRYRQDQNVCGYRAGRILAPGGQLVGYWYSQNFWNIIEEPEPHVIIVYQPFVGGGMDCGEPTKDLFFP